MTSAEIHRIATARQGTYRAPAASDADCEFGPCADCVRTNCPGRVEDCRANPRVTPAERRSLLAGFDGLLDEDCNGGES
jgi:hypothetical protein